MAKYSYITDKTHNNRKIQVESAKRDGSGKNFENNYAKQNGYYGSMSVGLSNNFDTKLTEKDESAYNFRPTATMGSMELEVGSPCKVKKIIGGSVAFNQLANNGNFASDSQWSTSNATKSVANNVLTFTATTQNGGIYPQASNTYLKKVEANHKYLLSVDINLTTATNLVRVRFDSAGASQDTYTQSKIGWQNVSTIKYTSNGQQNSNLIQVQDTRSSNWDAIQIRNLNVIDLTQMFGSTIADYIYSLEQANAGSGVAWFKRYFPKEYYAYNSGELVSVKTQGKKITHFNQWDEELEQGGINSNDGSNNNSATTNSRSKNYMQVVPNTTYYWRTSTNSSYGGGGRFYYYDINKVLISYYDTYVNRTFITPANCYYVRFTTWSYSAYNHDICINFHYDGERDGEYEPYESETYPIDDIDLRGIPQLDENNNLVFDGDEYLADGNVTRKYGIVDLGTLSWLYNSLYNYWQATISGMKDNAKAVASNFVNGGWTATTQNAGLFYVDTNGLINMNNGSNSVEPTGYLIYELATPTDENSIPFTEVQECDNWGTEEWLAPTTDTRPCEVPVGHETDYLPDLKAKLEVAPTTPNENGVYVMEHNASGNSYTPIATWLSDNGYAKADTLPTKDSVGGTLRQLLATTKSLNFLNTNYVDLGSLNWVYSTLGGYFYVTLSDCAGAGYGEVFNGICTKYVSGQVADVRDGSKQGIACTNTGHDLCVRDSNYNDPTAFKNAMKGVLLAYEKAS